jgi:hypothetical protein
MGVSMKRKRDIQGKFTLKNQDYRQVRSIRLTDSMWKELGIASECLGITRADLLENLVQQNKGTFSDLEEIEQLNLEKSLNRDELGPSAEKVLKELRLGKQASSYKLVQKSLKRLIELILFSSK